jgi:predicted mannosyl-3-phosphoglycerate phosphatase (HAD superfamily)
MQTIQTTAAAPLPLSTPPCAAASLIVVSAIDDLWSDGSIRTAPEARAAVQWLVGRNIPLVLTTRRTAPEVLALQRGLGIRHPFVCEAGASLYIPAGYFPELTRIGTSRDGWNVVEFRRPNESGAAVRLLLSLYRLCSDGVVIVGLGQTGSDRVLLREVDVPVVVRSGTADETQLLTSVPSAYLTNAPGPAGWSEAILGSLPG